MESIPKETAHNQNPQTEQPALFGFIKRLDSDEEPTSKLDLPYYGEITEASKKIQEQERQKEERGGKY